MSLKDRLVEDMKTAMKAKEEGKVRLSVIRMARAAIKYAEIDKKTEFNDDAPVVEVLAREVKMRRDAIEQFTNANRPDKVQELNEEVAILMEYLPQQLTEGEIREIAKEIVAETGAQGAKDLGKVMGIITPRTKGRAEGKLVNQIVRELLGS
ncbi:GatB/YqeY domain-containing protein [Dehalobacter sp. DCM]|uniref:GatB/YqeY domain-containing protein n=1 Tax=Dehalobacter sp. DCM TaxID=2907827 RepID=UPI003082194B|nr:GatB/YqeY domain-containing protein [Dehalobacter sp. DCM]